MDEGTNDGHGAGGEPPATGGATVPREETPGARLAVADAPRGPRTAGPDRDGRVVDTPPDRGPIRRRFHTPAVLYELISNPALRAVLGWDLARRDVRWIPARPGATCLEVGSNGGFYTGALARHLRASATLVALDPHRDSLEALRRRPTGGSDAPMRQICGDGSRLPLGTSSVDVVFLGYCLEEIPDPHRAVSEAHRVLRPGGRLVVFLWRPAMTRRRREPVVDRLRELFEVERERFGPQNIRLRYRRPDR